MLMLDGSLVLQLHRAEAEEHGRRPPGAEPGVGILLYCGVPDIYAAYDPAGEMKAEVESEPTFIEAAGHTEFVVHDPDGYAGLNPFQRGDVKRLVASPSRSDVGTNSMAVPNAGSANRAPISSGG